jgi:fucose 4-O-acetylase-like acetyltransferase
MTAIGEGPGERRNAGIDMFRGLLVLAVLLGHFSELTERQSLLTWFGTGFRMPVFIGLTGYMFNLDRARTMPLAALLRRYLRRLVIPWGLACAVHLVAAERLTLLSPITIFVQPPFHLWFVPVMMAFVIVAAISRRTPTAMLAIAIPISIGAMYLFGVGHGVTEIARWMPDRRFFIYPIFFFFGLWVASRQAGPWTTPVAIVLAGIGILWWCRLYQQPMPVGEVAAELISGLSLVSLLPVVRRLPLTLPPIDDIGRQSLFFYLWHPMVFGLWLTCGVRGSAMLVLSLATLVGLRAVIARAPRIAWLLGVESRRPRPESPRLLPVVVPLSDPAP